MKIIKMPLIFALICVLFNPIYSNASDLSSSISNHVSPLNHDELKAPVKVGGKVRTKKIKRQPIQASTNSVIDYTIYSDKNSYTHGEPIFINVEIKYTGNDTLAFSSFFEPYAYNFVENVGMKCSNDSLLALSQVKNFDSILIERNVIKLINNETYSIRYQINETLPSHLGEEFFYRAGNYVLSLYYSCMFFEIKDDGNIKKLDNMKWYSNEIEFEIVDK